MAGAVASESDVERNGCQECPLGHTSLLLWRTQAPITDAAAARTIAAGAPTATIDANLRYQSPLDPADYLLCAAENRTSDAPPCAAFRVAPGKVTTINVKLIFGATSLMVFDAGSAVPRSTAIFDFSAAPP